MFHLEKYYVSVVFGKMLGRMHPRTNSSIRIGTSAHKHATFPSPRICSLYLSVETRRMQPLNGRFPSGAAGFRLFGPPRLRTHFPSVRREEPTGPRLIQDIVSTLLKAVPREPARYVIYRSLPHELPTRASFLSPLFSAPATKNHRGQSIPLIVQHFRRSSLSREREDT